MGTSATHAHVAMNALLQRTLILNVQYIQISQQDDLTSALSQLRDVKHKHLTSILLSFLHGFASQPPTPPHYKSF